MKRKTRSNPQNYSEGFEIDQEIADSKYNQIRKPSLPYGIIINDQRAGILIPSEQLAKAEWKVMPEPEELTTIELSKEVTGLMLTKCRLIILAFVPECIRWKDMEDNGEQAGALIGLYDEYRHSLNKKYQEVCSEHALVFLNANNQPLHKVPITVRFKNVALWSFKSAREEYYRQLEKAFAKYTQTHYSGKSDKWRSLGVLEVIFKGVKQGGGKNKSYCCKTMKITSPTVGNLPRLFMGTPKRKELVWALHREIAGFVEANDEQLTPLKTSGEPEMEGKPPHSSNSAGTISQVSDDELDLED